MHCRGAFLLQFKVRSHHQCHEQHCGKLRPCGARQQEQSDEEHDMPRAGQRELPPLFVAGRNRPRQERACY